MRWFALFSWRGVRARSDAAHRSSWRAMRVTLGLAVSLIYPRQESRLTGARVSARFRCNAITYLVSPKDGLCKRGRIWYGEMARRWRELWCVYTAVLFGNIGLYFFLLFFASFPDSQVPGWILHEPDWDAYPHWTLSCATGVVVAATVHSFLSFSTAFSQY